MRSAVPFKTILYEKKDAVAYVALNRPKAINALNQQAISELRSAFEDARHDLQFPGVIIAGACDRPSSLGRA